MSHVFEVVLLLLVSTCILFDKSCNLHGSQTLRPMHHRTRRKNNSSINIWQCFVKRTSQWISCRNAPLRHHDRILVTWYVCDEPHYVDDVSTELKSWIPKFWSIITVKIWSFTRMVRRKRNIKMLRMRLCVRTNIMAIDNITIILRTQGFEEHHQKHFWCLNQSKNSIIWTSEQKFDQLKKESNRILIVQ